LPYRSNEYPMVMKDAKSKRISELDTLRGIAAIYVVLFHYSMLAGYNILFLKAGVTGVDLFFLISGYVILMTLEKTRQGYDFIVSRLSRLYPSFLVMLLITLSVIYFFNRIEFPPVRTILLNLTMLQPVFKVPYIDDSYWTLTVEMEFYVFMLIVFMANKIDRIVVIGSLVLGMILIYYIIASFFFSESKIYVVPRSILPLISHFQLFLSGILFYKMREGGERKWQYHLLIGICFLISIFLFDKSGRSHFFIGRGSYGIAILVYLSCFYLFVNDKLQFLRGRVFSWLGAISYCLYLIHQETGKILYLHLKDSVKLPPSVLLLLLFLLMIILSSLVTYLIERPLIRFIRRKLISRDKFTMAGAIS
jgi:peptidoglycan/LPS O-acetylase OafA/YrhL